MSSTPIQHPADLEFLREKLRSVEHSRRELLRVLLEAGAMVEGSYLVVHRRCGKPNCACAEGPGHEKHYLGHSRKGGSKQVYVRQADREAVRPKAEQYRAFRQARADLMKLAHETADLADQLQRLLTEPYPPTDDADG